MSHISSGEGTPAVVQVSCTLSPSIIVTLGGLSVAVGNTTNNQREAGKKVGGGHEDEENREGGGFNDGLKRVRVRKLKIHHQLLALLLKHRARFKLKNKSGRAGTHSPLTTTRDERQTLNRTLFFFSFFRKHTHHIAFKHT